MSFRLVPKSVTLNGVIAVILRYFSEFGYLPGILRKSSCSLSHLLMSSCSFSVRPTETSYRIKVGPIKQQSSPPGAQFSGAMAVNDSLRHILQVCIGPVLRPLRENVMSSIKPEVHNVLHCRRRRTEPRPLATYRNFAKFGRVFLRYANGQT